MALSNLVASLSGVPSFQSSSRSSAEGGTAVANGIQEVRNNIASPFVTSFGQSSISASGNATTKEDSARAYSQGLYPTDSSGLPTGSKIGFAVAAAALVFIVWYFNKK